MAMERIIKASKWAVGGENLQIGTHLHPIRAFMGDMMTITDTAPCTDNLLAKLNENGQGKFRLANLGVCLFLRGR